MAPISVSRSRLRPQAADYVPLALRPAGRVLGSTELLTQIILELPKRDVGVVQRVAKVWRAIVNDTKAGQAARTLSPLVDQIILNTEHGEEPERDLLYPEYVEDVRFHPLLRPKFNRTICATRSSKLRIVRFSVPRMSHRPTYRRANEFVSDPPITTMLVFFGLRPRQIDTYGCHLRVPGGIKISDFQKVQRALAYQTSLYVLTNAPEHMWGLEKKVSASVIVKALDFKHRSEP